MEISRKSMLKKIKSDGIILFGAGDFARGFYRDFGDEVFVKYCMTNNPAEVSFCVDGMEVCPIYRVEDRARCADGMIIICARLCGDMMRQLQAYGLSYGIDYIDSGFYRMLAFEKKIALFYGVCYMRALYNCLAESKAFTDRYVLFYFLDYHAFVPYDDEKLRLLLRLADLYLCHESADVRSVAYRSHLKPSCRILRVPLVTFNGYHPRSPEKIGTDNVYSIVPRDTYFGSFLTPDDNVNWLLREGMGISEIIKIISDEGFYEKDYLEQNFRKEIRKIQLSEMRSDVAVSDFILEQSGKARLFLNEKHMNNFLILELARRMLAFLELPQELPEEKLMRSRFLYTSEVPLYPAVIRKLKLSVYDGNPKYRLFTFGREMDVTFEEYYERYYEYCRMMKSCMEEGYFPTRGGI